MVNQLREFIKTEYNLKSLHIIDEKHSPTRGLYRDDGGLVMLSGDGVMNLDLANITSINNLMKELPDDIKILHGQGFKDAIANM